MNYAEQLQQPEWQEKRQEVLSLYDYKCAECSEAQGLHIHHLTYSLKKMAWEYDNDNLVCLCQHHHKLKHLPHCCDTPIFKLAYDINSREDTLIPLRPMYCPFCGTPIPG